ncbi:MAG TPA: glycosyltransferase family 4 protein [Capsulimonadaceae bacterium]|jgi:glycosyltransferase involved in cell wall biosynthesis
MSLRIAYVIGGFADSKLDYLVDSGKHPSVEYRLIASRNDAELMTYDDIPSGRSLWSKLWRSLDRPQFGLASLALEHAIKYDAIIASGEDIGLPLAIGSLLDTLNIPIYIITHGSYFGSPKFNFVAALVRRAANVHFLCLSETLCSQLTSTFRIPESRVHNTSYGIDTDFFHPAEQPVTTSVPIIASAGTAFRDYRTLVAACDGLEADVKIAADSAWFPLAIDIEDDQLPRNVEARSYGDYMALRDLYGAARIVVVPLYPAKHACGYAVIAEAMAMGKCVVTTETESRSDFLIDGETGFYVPPRDPKALRAKLDLLLADPALAARMGAAGRKRMEQQFSLDAYCKRIESVAFG